MKVNILKNLGMVLLASFIGIMTNPEMLMASDSVAVYGVDTSNAVETVVEIAPETNSKVVSNGVSVVSDGVSGVSNGVSVVSDGASVTIGAPAAGVAESKKAVENTIKMEQTARVAESVKVAEPVKTVTAPASNVRFSWGVQEIFRASSTAVNAGDKAARMGKLVWGHNYTTFGNIVGLKIGDTFTISESGSTTTYRVVANPINGAAGVVLDKKSEAVLSYAGDARYSNIDMNALVNYGMGHSLVLMTCYGSNSRYVVVADAM